VDLGRGKPPDQPVKLLYIDLATASVWSHGNARDPGKGSSYGL
jgi:hypothetical protein